MKGSKEKTSRNEKIYDMWIKGKSFAEIGALKKYNLSRERVRVICLRERERQQKSGINVKV